MAAGTLYTYPDNFRAAKGLIAAQYSKKDVTVDQKFKFGETNKTKEFLSKFPTGKVPAFSTTSTPAFHLQDSNAIAFYLSNDQLRGKDLKQQTEILNWIGFAESEILPAACAWVFPILGIVKKTSDSDSALGRAKTDVQAFLKVLQAHLLEHTYLVGEYITLADVVVACNLLNLYKYALQPEFKKPFFSVNRWFTTLINQPEFKAVLGKVEFPNAAEPAAVNAGKKNEKKKQQKEVVEESDAIDDILAAEPKSKDPFDAMPKGTFNMDDFKRFYSNEEEAKSIPYFWTKFDPKHYSIWYGEYKYPKELSKVFMSCNLISGMYQRLDKMRKQAFASVCVFGKDDDNTISGVWVWRGQDLVFPLSPDWQIDYESYEWKKLDPDSEDTKNIVAQYFSWTGKDKQGRDFNQGKIFK